MKGKAASPDATAHISGQSNEPMARPAHNLTADEVALELDTNPTGGLSVDEAAQRLGKYGPNDLGQEKGVSAVAIFMQQIFNSMTLVCLSFYKQPKINSNTDMLGPSPRPCRQFCYQGLD
jgi:magnesium-transporting ATPase (P-type)